MRAFDLGRARASDDGPIGLLWATVERRPRGPLTWAESGFSFVPLRQAHLDFMGAVYGRDVPPLAECEGRVLVDSEYLPLGVLLVQHQLLPNAGKRRRYRRMLHAHFGRWLKTFPKDILRGVKPVCDSLRARKIYILHCSADESVKDSDKLALWLRGVPTGERNEQGPIYRIDLRRTKI